MPARKLTVKQDREVVQEYIDGSDSTVLAKKYDVSKNTILLILRRHKVSRSRRRRYTEEIQQELCRRYTAGEHASWLAAELNLDNITVLKILRERGVVVRSSGAAKRVHAVNEAFFDTITPDSAWLIGFIMADGNVLGGRLSIRISAKDIDVLYLIRRLLQTDAPISKRWSTSERTGTHLSAGMNVFSVRIVKSLARYGVLPRKSFTAKVIGLEHDKNFWRGVIDGDGYLYAGINGRYGVSLGLVGSLSMMEQFVEFAARIYPDRIGKVRPKENIFGVQLSQHASIAIIDYLYRYASTALPRKSEKAKRIIACAVDREQIPPGGWLPGMKLMKARRVCRKRKRRRNDFDGAKLRALRFGAEICQRNLGQLLGINQMSVSDYERNRYEPSLETIARICSFFDISPADLLP